MKEATLQNLIKHQEEIQENLKSILGINDIQLISEDKYINGITADFSVLSQKQIRAIIECKGSDIGVNEYVRGIGQILQYSYFHEENISPKGFAYASKFNVVLLFPSSVIKNNNFNIGRFKYPNDTIIVEVNDQSKVARKIDEKELSKLKEAQENNLVTISQYYVRDNRVFELYLVLKYVSFLKMKGIKQCDRKQAEESFLKKLNVPNNKNWRNAFISLASLGFIDNNNLPTSSGNRFAFMEFEEFAFELFEGYLKPYFEEIYNCFGTKQNIKLKNLDFAERIKKKHKNRDVLFLTESEGRYISSWLNILRDDYACLAFEARKAERQIVYNILQLNKEAILQKIRSGSVAYQYITSFHKLLH